MITDHTDRPDARLRPAIAGLDDLGTDDGSLTIAFTLHPCRPPEAGSAAGFACTLANDDLGTAPCSAGVEDPMDVVGHDTEVERAIDELIDGAPPPDWDDPAAIAARREQLTGTAFWAAELTTELLVHSQLALARGVQARVTDPPVVAAARAIEALHRSLCSYRRATGRWDGPQAVQDAMAVEAGPGIARVATGLLERLRADLTERMRESLPPRAD